MAKNIIHEKTCPACHVTKPFTLGNFFLYAESANYPDRLTHCRPCLQVGRFWGYVLKTETCWTWTGRCNADGYGVFDHTSAHRFSWTTHYGAIPPTTPCVLHECDNPPCIRPDHLYCGTKKDNYEDMVRRGRQSPKVIERLRDSVLTPEIVIMARQMRATKKLSHKKIWEALGKPAAEITLSQAISGVTWKHLPLS